MTEGLKQNSIRDKVLQAIESGKVKMRPRWYFVARTALLIVGTVFAFFTVLYVLSLIVFLLHQSGTWFAPVFGFHGIGIFLSSLPWILVVVAVVFFALLEILVQRYSFAYAKPLFYSAVGIIVFAVIGSIIVARTEFHQALFIRALEERLPIAGALYRNFGDTSDDSVVIGIVGEITDKGFRLSSPQEEIFEIELAASPMRHHDINVGDIVVVIGERENNTIKAEDISKVRGRGPVILHHSDIPPMFMK